jgi:hypothetical protein
VRRERARWPWRVARGAALALLALAVPLGLVNSRIWPLGRVIAGDVGGDYGSFTWNFWAMAEAAAQLRNPYRTELLYHPVGATLTRHSYAAGFLPVALAARALRGSPDYAIYAYRGAIWLSLSLGLVTAFLFHRGMGLGRCAAAFGACVFVFSASFLSSAPHMNILAGAFVLPSVAMACLRLWRRPGCRSAALLGAVVGGAVYFSEYAVYAALGAGLVLTVLLIDREPRVLVRERAAALGWKGLAAAALVLALVTAPFVVSWLPDVAKAPKEEAARQSSADLVGFLLPNGNFQPLYAWLHSPPRRPGTGIDGRASYLGWPLLLAAGLGWPLVPPLGRRAALVLAAGFVVLSLGPVLHVAGPEIAVPLPYRLLGMLPPFNMSRTPVRLVAVALFGLSVLGAAGFQRLWDTRAGERGALGRAAALTLLAWGLCEGYRTGPATAPVPALPELARLAPGPVLNLPLSFKDGHAMFLQVFHGHPILTGRLARRTAAQVEHVRSLDAALEQRGASGLAEALRKLGTRNVIARGGVPPRLIRELEALELRVVSLPELR